MDEHIELATSTETDWGFSFLSDNEIKEKEVILKKQVDEHNDLAAKQAVKIDRLRNRFTGFLEKLKGDPSKEWFRWPNRAEKIESFIQEINQIADSD